MSNSKNIFSKKTWKDNKMHGLGKANFANGEVAHDGKWENNQPKK